MDAIFNRGTCDFKAVTPLSELRMMRQMPSDGR
jgi:hypothetical protein